MTYQEFINNILQNRGRFACGEEYHERHHIVPRCMGGDNDKENLIDLYAKEHFEAHRILALENPDNKDLQFALWCMAYLPGKKKQRQNVTGEEYEEARKNYIQNSRGEKNPNFGNHLSEEAKKSIGDKNKNHAQTNLWRWGRKLSEETKAKISKSRMGKPSATRRKIAQYNKNGDLIKIWDYVMEITKELGFDASNIVKCARGKLRYAYGYKWIYTN